MAEYLKAFIGVRVRMDGDKGCLTVDRESVAVGDGDDYWATARMVTDRPGAMVALWYADNLLIPEWKSGPLDTGTALRWAETSVANRLLTRSDADLFFEDGTRGYYLDRVRWPSAEEAAS